MDTAESEHTLALGLIAETENLRNLIFALVGGSKTSLEAPSVALPKLDPAELGFIRMVSWLFVLYFETGRISIKFLVAKFSTYGTDHDGRLLTHFHTVRCLGHYFNIILSLEILMTCRHERPVTDGTGGIAGQQYQKPMVIGANA